MEGREGDGGRRLGKERRAESEDGDGRVEGWGSTGDSGRGRRGARENPSEGGESRIRQIAARRGEGREAMAEAERGRVRGGREERKKGRMAIAPSRERTAQKQAPVLSCKVWAVELRV